MRLLFSFVIFFALTSCGDRNLKTVTKQYDDSYLEIPSQYHFCLVIPEGGCGGCISNGMSLVKNNMQYMNDNNDILCVFTAISSEKLIRRGLKLKGNHKNIIFDYNNAYFIRGENEIYPMLLTLDNGKIIDIEYVSPQNPNVLSKVEQWIER